MTLAEQLEKEAPRTSFTRLNTSGGVNVGRLVGGIFMGVGAILLTVAIYLYVSNNKFAQRAIRTTGKVIDFTNHQSRDDDGGSTTMYTPIFEYQFQGQTYQHTGTTSSSSPAYDIGETVDVLVDPGNPREILIDDFWEKSFVAVLLGVMGVIFTGIGYIAFRAF